MKYFFVFLAIIFISSVLGINMVNYSDRGISKSEQAVHNLFDRAAKDFKKKYKMLPVGTNVAMPRGNIKLLGLDFQFYHPLNKETIRQILINCAQEFLTMINSDEEIRPYLKKYPFEMEDINIILFMKDENREEVYDPGISTAQISHNKLTYYTVSEENTLRYKSRISESYEEALLLLESNK